MNYNKIMVLVFVFIPFQTVSAQNKLSGKITNRTDQSALPFVSVFIPELQIGTMSDENGNYLIENIPSIPIRIQFSLLGFRTIVSTVNFNTLSVLDEQLDPSATELEEVLVTSNNPLGGIFEQQP